MRKLMVQLHIALSNRIEAFPYSIPKFLPHLLCDILAEHASEPTPISSTIRACAASFQRSHADTWHQDKLKFTEDQLSNLSFVISGTSYCESDICCGRCNVFRLEMFADQNTLGMSPVADA